MAELAGEDEPLVLVTPVAGRELGPDGLILEGRGQEPIGDPGDLARAFCRRGRADGLIVVESPRPGDPDAAIARMRLWNADGSAAEIFGNGARCVARFLVDQGAAPESIGFASDILATAQVNGDFCRLQMPIIARVFPGRRLRVEGRDLAGRRGRRPLLRLLTREPDGDGDAAGRPMAAIWLSVTTMSPDSMTSSSRRVTPRRRGCDRSTRQHHVVGPPRRAGQPLESAVDLTASWMSASSIRVELSPSRPA